MARARGSPTPSGRAHIRAGAGVQTDKTAESMVEIRKELREVLTTRKPDDAELKFAKDSIAIALPGNNETSDEIAGSYGEILTFGLKDTYWNDFVGEVTALTPADVNKSRRRAHSSGSAHLGGGGRSVEDREAGARAELRRSHGHRYGRQARREVVSPRTDRRGGSTTTGRFLSGALQELLLGFLRLLRSALLVEALRGFLLQTLLLVHALAHDIAPRGLRRETSIPAR